MDATAFADPLDELEIQHFPLVGPDTYEISRLKERFVTARRGYKREVTYFAQAMTGGPIKIGRSTDGYNGAHRRLASLQTGNPNELSLRRIILDDHEQLLHTLFADFRLNGEWFAPVYDLTDLCNGINADASVYVRAYERGYERGLSEGEDRARLKAIQAELEGMLLHAGETVVETIGRYYDATSARHFARSLLRVADRDEAERWK